MNPTDDLDRILDRALDEIRNECPDAEFERAATARVRQQLVEAEAAGADARKRLNSCADFQLRLADFLDGRLSPARRLLVEDHVGECVHCRRALKEVRYSRNRGQRDATVATRKRKAWYSTAAWRVAAAAVIFIALVGVSVQTEVFSFETGGLIRIRSVEGQLYRIGEQGTEPLSEGQSVRLEPGDEIRTAKGSRALIELADRSSVEMRERAELAVKERRSWLPGIGADGVIGLQRGNIIVEASDQGSGHLFVNTDDCRVAVQGTVFSVNHGMKGSRVSVIEGRVQLDHGGSQNVLSAGQQATTNPALSKVPVAQEIAWSQNLSRHLELLREVRALEEEMTRALRPGMRYATDLLDVAPAGTVLFAGLPNVSDGLGEAYDILKQRVAASELLSDWWTRSVQRNEETDLDEIIEKIRFYGEHMGEEVALTLQLGADDEPLAPLFLARLERPETFRDLLVRDMEALTGEGGAGIELVLIEGDLPATEPAEAGPNHGRLFFWSRDGLLAVSPEFAALPGLAASLAANGHATGGPAFHGVLAERYANGVEWIAGLDLERILGSAAAGETREFLDELGLSDARHLVVEHNMRGEIAENRAELTFSQRRRNFASWLAEPAPIGSLDYVSPDANFAVGFAMMDLGDQVDQLLALLGGGDPGFAAELEEFERQHGIDIRRDLAQPLGGELVVALDGPVLPAPSWKVILEVYDPARLEQTLDRLVAALNELADDAGRQGFRLERTEMAGRRYFEMGSLDSAFATHFTFDEGYLVAASSRGILDLALQARRLGINLPASDEFTALLPPDGQVNFSGVVYQKLGPVVAPLANLLGGGVLDEADRQLVQAVGADSRPGVILFYGESDRISVVGTSESGVLGSALGSLFGFHSFPGVQESMLRAGARGAS